MKYDSLMLLLPCQSVSQLVVIFRVHHGQHYWEQTAGYGGFEGAEGISALPSVVFCHAGFCNLL